VSVETRSIDLFADRYVAVAEGCRTVLLIEFEARDSRVHLGVSLPDPATVHYLPISSYEPWSFDGLGSHDCIFMRAEYSARALINAEKRAGGSGRDGHVRLIRKS
jgi:hypothetical protein